MKYEHDIPVRVIPLRNNQLPSPLIRYQLAYYHNWKQDQGANHENEMERFLHFRNYMTWPMFRLTAKGKQPRGVYFGGKEKCNLQLILKFMVGHFH